ncbi:hypothetical protein ACFPL7_07700 [Dongia soli]|uniref:Flagellar protein FlgN n=1 Tax=Dongia soli TaxID=600628 RepID=A0ABU5EBI6_9PROT|nr:hypothetical protein [Dongia soli]MDY0882828.1 hypothetical protein [Dongia soli]
MTKSSRIAELLAITSRLIACMEREVELLRNLKPQELRQLQSDKMALADAYRAFALALREPAPESEAVDDVLRQELVEATERFQAAVQDNLRALRAMRDVNERVMRAIVHALEEPRAQVTGYNSRGVLTKSRRQAAMGPVAVQQRA